MKRFLLLTLLLACASACAPLVVDSRLDEARQLIAMDRVEEALGQVQALIEQDPRNAELRAFAARERELAIARWLAQADFARASANYAASERYLDRVLRLEPGNTRATLMREEVRRARRHDERIAEANTALARGDIARAETLMREVLKENPHQRGALVLQRRIAERRISASAVTPQLAPSFSKPISVEFRDANLRQVFELLSRSHGVNFVFDKDVRSDTRVTIFVRNTSLDEVMRLILATNQLARKVLGPTSVLIYPNTPAKQREYQDLVMRSFYLGNADAKQTLTMIKTMLKTRDVYIDEKINMLVMRDTPEVVRMAEKLIASQDMAEPEVMLELEVLEVSRNKLTELGVRLPSQVSFGPLDVPPGEPFRLSSSQLTATVVNPAVLVNLRLQDSTTNTLANPRVRVRNREKARIHIGEKVPVVTTTATANVGVSASVSYLEVGLKLDVEPTIHLSDEVAIKVELEVSNILETIDLLNTRAYRLGTRNASTVLRLRNGETQVLAGLISDDERKAGNKVPGLGELPVVGRLFGSELDNQTKTEIVLLITPRIMRNINRPEAYNLEYQSGTEAAIGAAPLRLSGAIDSGVAIEPSQPGAADTRPTVAPPARRDAPPLAPPASAPPGMTARAKPAAPPDPSAGRIALSAPAQAGVGSAFGITVTLPAGADAGSAELELGYDPRLLQVIGAGGGGDNPVTVVPTQPGRLLLRTKSSGQGGNEPIAVQFRVVATGAAETEVVLSNAQVFDRQGRPLALTLPAPHALRIGP